MQDRNKIEVRPKNWLTPVALVILREESSYGYELMDRIEEEFGFEPINPGSVYRALRQMEKEGLCRSEWDAPRKAAFRVGCTPSPTRGKRT